MAKFKRSWTMNKMQSPSPDVLKKLKQLGDQLESVKYGSYRESIDEATGRMNLVNFIPVPSRREFEWMFAHVNEKYEREAMLKK